MKVTVFPLYFQFLLNIELFFLSMLWKNIKIYQKFKFYKIIACSDDFAIRQP